MRLAYPVLWSRLTRQASQEQTANTAAALARRGVEVTLIVPQGRDDPPFGAAEFRDWFAVEGDVAIVQRPSRWAGDPLFRSLLWLRQVFRDPALRGADLLYSRIPVMIAIGQFSPLPFATDLFRPWPDEQTFLRPFVGITARRPHCLGYIAHSQFAADGYRRAGVPAEKLLVAHNGADPDRMLPQLDKAEARKLRGLPPARPIVLYAGRLNEQKGLDQIFALADLRPDILFLLVGSEGDGPIERAATGRPNVEILPWQGPRDLSPLLYAADILVIPPSSAPLERFGSCVLPMKLFTYLAAGRPILAPRSPDTAELLDHERNALLVTPDRPEEAAAALDRLLGDPGLADRLGDGGRSTAAGMTWDSRAEKIEKFLAARLA